MEERPNRVRLEGIAIEVGGALKGAFNFVTNRTCTRLAASSTLPSMSIPAIKKVLCRERRVRSVRVETFTGKFAAGGIRV